MTPYMIVAADFSQTGGMDVANYAFARYLARRGNEVHLVAHRVAEDLAKLENVVVHEVAKPLNSYLLGEPLLDRAGRYWAARITARKGRVVVNGGNCQWGDVNWVHYVHAAYPRRSGGTTLHRLKEQWAHRRFLRGERNALSRARVVFANSTRTKTDLVQQLAVPANRVHTVYLGIDPTKFRPPSAGEKLKVRASLGWSLARPIVVFVGALGDRRKGFDTAFSAWASLCRDPSWDADLVVAGTGAELAAWQTRAFQAGLADRIRFLGFRSDIPVLLSASDAIIAPTRYESYGVGVQEAICCGLPALVSRTAGVAEQYPPELQDLLLPVPDDAADLVLRLRGWRNRSVEYAANVASFSAQLRAHTWDHMAADMVRILEA